MKKEHPEFQSLWIDCGCGDKAHAITFEAILEEDDEMTPAELVISTRLRNWRGFFRRLWVAFCYLIGKECRFGEYDCFLTSSKDKLLKMREMIDKVIEVNERKGWEIPTRTTL